MAYPKITVNTGLVLPLTVLSDTINIPYPGAQITGTGTAVASGANDTVTADKLVNSTLTGATAFNSTTAPLPIEASVALGQDRVYNTSTPGNALVTAVDSGTTLSLSGNIFGSQPQNYLITRPNHLIDTSATFITSGVQPGDIVWNTTAFTAAYVLAVDSEVDLHLSADIFGSDTTYNDNYTVFTGQEGGLKSSEGCLIYVGDNTTGFYDVSVLPTANSSGVVFRKIETGKYLPVQVKRVFSTGTTADALLAIW